MGKKIVQKTKKGAASAKSSKKKTLNRQQESKVESSFSPSEKQALQRARKSSPFRDELAALMKTAASKVVRAAFKKQGITLTTAEAGNLAEYIFGTEEE